MDYQVTAYNLYSSLGFVPITNEKTVRTDVHKGYIQMVKI